MEGFVYFHRKIKDWQWYDDANTFRVFFHLILSANYKDSQYRGVEIKRGQHLTSRARLAKELNISEQQVRTSLRRLNKEEITCKPTSKYTLITINHYNTYQSYENEINQQANQQLTSDQPATNQQLTTNNKNNKNNKDNKDNKRGIAERKKDFANKIAEFKKLYSSELLRNFYEYWTEHGENDKKMRFEKEKSYDLKRRLKTWSNRESSFNNNQQAKHSNKNFSQDWNNKDLSDKYEWELDPDYEPLSEEEKAQLDNMPF